MKPFIRIDRYPFEEPYNFQIRLRMTNGKLLGDAEIYVAALEIAAWGAALSDFPRHRDQVYLWEVGSEHPEDRWSYYMRLRAWVTDSVGHCALHIRYNNNRDLPHREIFEFSTPMDAASLNRLGQSLASFSSADHEVLIWTQDDTTLYQQRKEAEQASPANHRPFGTSGMASANSASRAEAMPEASGDS